LPTKGPTFWPLPCPVDEPAHDAVPAANKRARTAMAISRDLIRTGLCLITRVDSESILSHMLPKNQVVLLVTRSTPTAMRRMLLIM
jgi:hypothetical protein